MLDLLKFIPIHHVFFQTSIIGETNEESSNKQVSLIHNI